MPPADSTAIDSIRQNDDYLLACNDSIFGAYANWEAPTRESLFALREQHSGESTPQLRQEPAATDWVFGIMALLLLATSLYLNNQKFKLKDILQSLFDRRIMERVFRENNLKPYSLLPMTCIYIGSLTLVANELICNTPGFILTKNTLLQYLMLFVALTVYYLIKNALINMFGSLFEDRHTTTLCISSNYLFCFLGGIAAMPLALLHFFSPIATSTILTAIGILVSIVFVLRLTRCLQIILSNSKSSKLYLFYYLCIVEIVPILLVTKGIIS